MSTLILGSVTSIEPSVTEVSQYDPNLDSLWDAAVAAGTVTDDGTTDPAVKAARLSAVVTFQVLPGQRECHISTSDDPLVALKEICDPGGVIDHHFAPTTGPIWVEGDNDSLVGLIAAKYQCPTQRPDGWEVTYDAPAPASKKG